MASPPSETACETTVQIVVAEEAAADIVAAYDWYEERRPGLGAQFELCVEEAFDRIIELPFASPVWYRATRRTVLARFPYGIFYVAGATEITVVAVLHFKRNPRLLRRVIRHRTAD
jgi:toxin ParE1/3/4